MRAGSNWRHLNGLSLGMMGDPVRCLPKVVHPDVAALKLQHNRLMRIPWPTDGGPILFQHGFEYLQARRDDQLLELGLRINEDIDQRQVTWRRGYRLATARDCARLLLHGGSLLGGLHLGFVTGRIARPVKSRRFKFQQLLGHPLSPPQESHYRDEVEGSSHV